MHCKPCLTDKVLDCGERSAVNLVMAAFPVENLYRKFDGSQNCSERGVDEKDSYHYLNYNLSKPSSLSVGHSK